MRNKCVREEYALIACRERLFDFATYIIPHILAVSYFLSQQEGGSITMRPGQSKAITFSVSGGEDK